MAEQGDQSPQDERASLMGRLRPRRRVDTELEEFRSLMEPPGEFEEGFSWAAFLGALFVALMMVPGSIYMILIAGQTVGPAAQWVTVILFIEVARRANKHLKRAELFTIFYLAGAIMATTANVQGNFLGGLGALWSQFFVRSDAARAAGIADQIPFWVAPTDPQVLEQRSLLMWQWLPALGLIAFNMLMSRLDNMILGYGLFRLTSDVEKLPFPMAPVGAQGIMALSEEQEEEEAAAGPTDADTVSDEDQTEQPTSWRWRVFSIGTIIGLVFGTVYIGIPTITGALLDRPITIIPIPFIDYTQQTAGFLPATAVGVALDLSQVILGMVLPFWAMVGTFVGLMVTFVLNPILYTFSMPAIPALGLHAGHILSTWNPGDDLQKTFYENQIDFYFSFAIGIGLAIALAGFWSVGRAWLNRRSQRDKHVDQSSFEVPKGRGDIAPWLIVLVYVASSALYIGVSMWLLAITDGGLSWARHGGIFLVMLFYALLYTPVISYVTARLEGIAGQVLTIPFVREGSFILSGYHGLAVWFLPIPQHNYGQMTVFYRQAELTGTKFWSIWKSEILLMPIILIGSLGFAHFIWSLGPIPSSQYLYAQQWWEVAASQKALVFQSTLGGYTEFEQALNGGYILAGAVVGTFVFAGFAWLGAPTFFVYGVVRGLNQTLPFVVIPQFLGALIGRFYFQKRLGLMWRQYIPVVFAGYSCGVGLVGTLGIGFTFLAKSVFKLPF